MVNLEDLAFKQCLSLLESKFDEEKFVGILLVKNIIQPDDYKALDLVYQSLGLEFIYRLLQSKETKAEESISYLNLSITLLLTFVSLEYPTTELDPTITTPKTIAQKIINDPLLSDLLHLVLLRCSNDIKIENLNFIKESIQFLTTLCSLDNNSESSFEIIKILLQPNNIQLIGDLLLNLHVKTNTSSKDGTVTDDLLKLVKLYIELLYLIIWRLSSYFVKLNKNNSSTPSNNSSVQVLNQVNRLIGPVFQLLEPLSKVFKDRVDEIKFSLLPILITLIQIQSSNDSIVIHSTNYLNALEWRFNLKYAIYTILSSKKLSADYRDHTVVLFSVLLDFMGHQLFTLEPPSTLEKAIPLETLLLLSLQWSRNEIHLVLMELDRDANGGKLSDQKSNILTSSYRIIEHVVEFLGFVLDQSEESDGTEQQIKLSLDSIGKMKTVMVDTMSIVINYIIQVAEENPDAKPHSEMIDAFRLLGLWLSEEAASISGPLQKSLPTILSYALKHKDDLGIFLCFLFPGLSLYLEVPANVERFIEQNGFVLVSNYLNLYLATLIRYVKDTNSSTNGTGTSKEASQNNYIHALNLMKSHGVTPNTIVNVILPRVSEILQVYFTDSYKNKPISNGNQITRSSFIQLVSLIVEQISILSKELDTSYWDTYLINQFNISLLMTLSLSILTHYDEKDFPTDTTNDKSSSLSALFLHIVQFYSSVEIPQTSNGNSNDNSYETLWTTIKDHYIQCIELILQNIDKYPSLSNILISKRWPPNDFQLPIQRQNSIPDSSSPKSNTNINNTNILGIDNQTIINVNRNISNLIRKLIELKSN